MLRHMSNERQSVNCVKEYERTAFAGGGLFCCQDANVILIIHIAAITTIMIMTTVTHQKVGHSFQVAAVDLQRQIGIDFRHRIIYGIH
jgi:hypothetical protein